MCVPSRTWDLQTFEIFCHCQLSIVITKFILGSRQPLPNEEWPVSSTSSTHCSGHCRWRLILETVNGILLHMDVKWCVVWVTRVPLQHQRKSLFIMPRHCGLIMGMNLEKLNFLLVRNSSLSPRYGGKACRSCANQHGWPVPRCGDGFERWGWWCHRRGHYRCEWVPQQHVPQHEQGPSWWWQPHVKHPCMQAGLLWVLESWTMENRYTTSSSAMTNNMHTYEHASTLVLL